MPDMQARQDGLAAYYFHQGTNTHAYEYLGCHCEKQDGGMFNRVLWSGELGSAADAVFMNTDISDIEETGYYDFSLAPRSPAIGVANKEVAIHCPEDIRGVSRTDDDGPDMGAYERTED